MVHDLIFYRDKTFIFLLLVNNYKGWMKQMVSMNSQANPIYKVYIGRWTHNQYIGKDRKARVG